MAGLVVDSRERKLQLRTAVRELSDRGLVLAAKWAAEQAAGLGTVGLETSVDHTYSNPSFKAAEIDLQGEEAEIEEDQWLLAKSFFEVKEHRRAAYALKDCKSRRSVFLRCFATFLAGEKRKEEELAEKSNGTLGRADVTNAELPTLRSELAEICQADTVDPFCLYIYGVVLKELELKGQAREILVRSVNAYPWNWSAWHDLAAVCPDRETVDSLPLRAHWMRPFFDAHISAEHLQYDDAVRGYTNLQASYPKSTYVLAQNATAKYQLRAFDSAQELFQELQKIEPCRLEHMDVYSNMLYVKEAKADLSYLAHNAALIDKYRPETCCIIGNYYSLRGQHEQAVLYFQRALRLNRNYLSAWTLIGHEFVEMKNTPAAIQAYRTAVDINSKDFRAWYGLGQTYEILHMPFYALYYYRKAATIRPYDARMWCAMAECYSKLARFNEAIKCYERAEGNSDREGIALLKLARLYKQLENLDKAAIYYKKNLDRRDAEEMDGHDTVECLLFLAHFCKTAGRVSDTEKYCSRLLDYAGPEKEEAKALLREMRSTQQKLAGRMPSPQGQGDKAF
eukprot:CAMPEP_0184374476 /NCGR_PEP_ID=MMETSP1089-20130417/165045_1 /TAXON_ID=38269 ORGANISM="Gloeochaete wittrockiana, Strain SAG46.84" /NCGR_SAMPLE_ID=MMETSP1089 /ASSEMBLY_ACC=CAM_ASM_000445 /LENGTH=565 /DNA_ID=CAMNT_0026717491 /DNA_START=2202 /DNA_END=3899 /DNA_ORIENTATION=-